LQKLFSSFFQGGFECSTHRLKNGRRLDLLAATEHDRFAFADYRRLRELGITTVREGIRWHLIEQQRHRYNFGSELPLLDAGLEAGVEQIFDLFHFGWPDHLNVFSADFVSSFAELAFEWARLLRSRGVNRPFVAPCNEISFFSWAGGDQAYLNPFEQGRGSELKRQMVKAAVSAAQVLINGLPGVTLLWPEPVIHIAGDPNKPGDDEDAERYRLSMFEVWDMISGQVWPELEGRAEFLQVIGVNFYDRNEWVNHGRTLKPPDAEYKPFSRILEEVWNRYRLPIFVSETGTEDDERAAWLALIAREVRTAIRLGVPVHAICLYPIVNHPGWDDDRHCYNGLLDYPYAEGYRRIYEPLAAEIANQQRLFTQLEKEQESHEQTTTV
jgi:hypothetical protein